MTDVHVRNFANPDEVIEDSLVRSEAITMAGVTITHDIHQPGWRWSVNLRPKLGVDSCQTRHVGVALTGKLHVILDDGTEFDVEAGEVYHIPPGHDGWVIGDEPFENVEWIGSRRWLTPLGELAGRVLSTLVFTDIVDSTGTAQRMGDSAWREILGAYEARVQDTLNFYRGSEVKKTGDGVLATFDSAARAVRCAVELRAIGSGFGLETRSSIHTGEVVFTMDDIHGIVVHEAARMLSFADPGEIIVSSTTRELSRDEGIKFLDRGEHQLRGVEGLHHLYSVVESHTD